MDIVLNTDGARALDYDPQMQDRDPLNYFQPYERLPARHENQLTRALLLVLRLCPTAHVAWLRRVANGYDLYALPEGEFETQKRAVRKPADSEAERETTLISVFLAPEKPLTDTAVTESDRGQVLDGIINYGSDLCVVIESKVVDGVDADQAEQINVAGAGVSIGDGQKTVYLRWRTILDDFAGLLERDFISATERVVLSDFLSYVEDHFGELGSYRTLAVCRGNKFRCNRRLRILLGEAWDGGDAIIDRHGPMVTLPDIGNLAAHAYLKKVDASDGSCLELAVYPGDTLQQARRLYVDQALVEAVGDLAAEPGWSISSNFHFGHFEKGFVWTTGTLPVQDYLALWQSAISTEHANEIKRDEWMSYWEWLEANRIATKEDKIDFDKCFTNTARSKASPRPGLKLTRSWSWAGAEELDSSGDLVGEIRDALDKILGVLQQPK